MRILHYFLGFPPYRTGGLTKYAYDLMEEQEKDGNDVYGLWPGQIKNYNDAPYFKKNKSINGIGNLELINPLPVSLDEGIVDFEAYTKSCDIGIYIQFLGEVSPDIIHIHTLMGIHKEFIQAANNLKIRTVFTSHDYFGLCPKVTLYRYGVCCDVDNKCENCIQCNTSALSLKTIQLMQSPLYRWAKDISIVKKIRKWHRGEFFKEERIPNMPKVDVGEMSEKYKKLRAFYVEIYESIDFIHFNSMLAEKIYRRYIIPKDSKVVSITHKGISRHSRKKIYTGRKVIICLAPAKPFKGWNVLKMACDQLWSEGENIELRVYSPVPETEPYMLVKENGFNQDELERIMNEADVLVAPSIWYETFGFTVLEALSYGVPAIVSNHVGAKDLITDNKYIINAGNVEELKYAIKSYSTEAVNNSNIKVWSVFKDEIYEMYAGQ